MGSRFVVALLLLAACGDNLHGRGVIESGSRLRAKYLVSAGGDRVFQSFHDQDLDLDCTWEGTSPPRCLPERWVTEEFRDPSCAQPVVQVGSGPCAEGPAYVTVELDRCTQATTRVWPVGGLISLTTVFRRNASGVCTASSTDPTTNYRMTGVEVPLDRFVSGRVVDLGGGRILTRTVISDDGAVAPLTAFDREINATCQPSMTWEACVPEFSGTYLADDAGCTSPVLTTPTACVPPAYIRDSASQELGLFERGALVTADPTVPLQLYDRSVYVVATGMHSCTARTVTLREGVSLYKAGASVQVDTLVPVERVVGDGVRLEPWLLHSGGYSSFDGLYDAQLERDCTIEVAGPGIWRCMPESNYVSRFLFADPQCTQRTSVIFTDDSDDRDDSIAIHHTDDGTCGKLLEAYHPGIEIASGSVYLLGPNGCEPYTWDGVHAFSVGNNASLDQFIALTELIE